MFDRRTVLARLEFTGLDLENPEHSTEALIAALQEVFDRHHPDARINILGFGEEKQIS